MAQRVEVLLVDDIDESEAEETVSFALDGVRYEIDLNSEHAGQLRAALKVWTSHARRTGGRKSGGASPSRGGAQERAQIRAWARTSGFDIGEKGRISAKIRQAYAAAHSK